MRPFFCSVSVRPRHAKRAKETLATSRGLRRDIKGGARDWFDPDADDREIAGDPPSAFRDDPLDASGALECHD
jgi:hypothetical protein